jgi:hypothetical protein
VLRETTSRGLCGLGCPSRTSKRGGEGDCVKGGGGSARGSVHWSGYDATALDIEVDPQRRRYLPIIKLFARGEGDSGGHVLRETTSRGLCGLVCPSRTSKHGGEGDCVKEGGGGEGERERKRALGRLLCHIPRH